MSDLPAGRAIDVQVAAKVMGLNVRSDRMVYIVPIPDGTPMDFDIPAYSTDIAAAMEVVEKLQGGDGTYFEISWHSGAWEAAIRTDRWGTWYADGGETHGIRGEAREKTAPLAICRAALRAVGA